VRVLFWALAELKLLERDFATLGIEPRAILERGRRKQMAALQDAFTSLGWEPDRNYAAATLKAITEIAFPTDETRPSMRRRLEAAWEQFTSKDETYSVAAELDLHSRHSIKTARGWVGAADSQDADLAKPPAAAE
jgi:hypothetical protein